MDVVTKTLESRLTSEMKAQEEAKKLEEKMESIHKDYNLIADYIERLNIRNFEDYHKIENDALILSTDIHRHDYKNKLKELNEFVTEYNSFNSRIKYSGEYVFSSKVFYILGIAAYYNNDPKTASTLFSSIEKKDESESDESTADFKRRKANTIYFLGLIDANFGDHINAVSHFENSIKIDPGSEDLSTQIVLSQAYIQINKLSEAQKTISALIDEFKNHGSLNTEKLKQKSRIELIKTNIIIIKKDKNWIEKAHENVEKILQENQNYYFAVVTLAQLLFIKRDDTNIKYFQNAISLIDKSGDLISIKESHSRILLLMTAGMCILRGENDRLRANEKLDEASRILESLPMLNNRPGTVFSVFSKKRESIGILQKQIDQIRNGEVIQQS
jgi:tetratricopeptide (TPR) repeat protein